MPELKVRVDITVKCEKCNTELSTDFDERRAILTVEPCEKCLEQRYDDGLADRRES